MTVKEILKDVARIVSVSSELTAEFESNGFGENELPEILTWLSEKMEARRQELNSRT